MCNSKAASPRRHLCKPQGTTGWGRGTQSTADLLSLLLLTQLLFLAGIWWEEACCISGESFFLEKKKCMCVSASGAVGQCSTSLMLGLCDVPPVSRDRAAQRGSHSQPLLPDRQLRGFWQKVSSDGLSCAEVTHGAGCLGFWVTPFQLFHSTLGSCCYLVFQGVLQSLWLGAWWERCLLVGSASRPWRAAK